VLGAEIYHRKTLAPPQCQRFTMDGGALVCWTGRQWLERIGINGERK
jgi:hypothetical protein